jgi:hypothetical protein
MNTAMAHAMIRLSCFPGAAFMLDRPASEILQMQGFFYFRLRHHGQETRTQNWKNSGIANYKPPYPNVLFTAGSRLARAPPNQLEFRRSGVHTRWMDSPQRQTLAIMIGMIGGSAVGVAATLGYVAHYDFGLSRQQIRTPAIIGAALIAVLMAVEFFGKRLRKP